MNNKKQSPCHRIVTPKRSRTKKTPIDSSAEDAYRDFLKVDTFALGLVGIHGRPSLGEKLYRAVAASPNALQLFTDALTSGTPTAKLYALCGIRMLILARYAAYANPLMKSGGRVDTMRGCRGETESVSKIVERISKGVYDERLERILMEVLYYDGK